MSPLRRALQAVATLSETLRELPEDVDSDEVFIVWVDHTEALVNSLGLADEMQALGDTDVAACGCPVCNPPPDPHTLN